ncbi:MAG TPA: hypothetical protein VJP77_01095, partial [Planctomycetota bacterium]|nr:hypothetical protein [Planctomycetota bacterium]
WVAAVCAGLAACGGGGDSGGGGAAQGFTISEASNGFGALLPHTVAKIENGVVTNEIIAIRTFQDLIANVTPTNPIRPVPPFEPQAELPDGTPGNHFLFAAFTEAVDLASVFDQSPSATVNSNLTGSIKVSALDPVTGVASDVPGRAFIGGKTVGSLDSASGLLKIEKWIGKNPQGVPVALVPEAVGFPGTEDPDGFTGSAKLVSDKTVVFVVDYDGDLSTHDAFPTNRQIRMKITQAVRSVSGKPLKDAALACTTLGDDGLAPEVRTEPAGFSSQPKIVPADGETDVDPQTLITIEFTEPVQPTSVGSLPTGKAPQLSSAVVVTFGPQDTLTTVPFTVLPKSVYDLSVMDLTPAFQFPGTGPAIASCGTFSRIDIQVNPAQVADLAANLNTQGFNTFFETGEGPGIVNAPVAPDVIYVGRTGSQPSVSVVDLNGFGGGTGNPTYNSDFPIQQGATNFPNNPNVQLQGSLLVPKLAPGSCTINGGSRGVFSLAVDSALDDRLLRGPLISSISDMMIGQPLDLAFNNAPPPFGCQSGNPNVCAASGLKLLNPIAVSLSAVGPAQPGQFSAAPPGAGNIISWAPHPNPPPLVFPPPCVSPQIGGQEPTSIDSTATFFLQNLLAPNGDAFGKPELGIPPSGLLVNEQTAFFQGPSAPQSQISACIPYQIRQQVGHFLYVADRVRGEIVVVNSNRFTILDRIQVPDPTSLAMSPNVDLLAIASSTAGTVTFVDIDPGSSSFHQIIKVTPVGAAPRGIAWQPDNEDLFVCNEADNSVSIISAFDLEVRKVVKAGLNQPFEVALGVRQFATIGFSRGIYVGFVLGRNGRLTLFESGPDGISGIGNDNLIGSAPLTIASPRAMTVDRVFLGGGVWVAHENPFNTATETPSGADGGAVSNIRLDTSISGPQPLFLTGASIFNLRGFEFDVTVSIGQETLTGVPVDVAFDTMLNLGGLQAAAGNPFAAGDPAPVNSKSMLRPLNLNTQSPSFLFATIPNSNEGAGVIDVIEIGTGFARVDTDVFTPGVQSIQAPGAILLSDYYRQ